jgi:hypothetical protein
MNTTMVEPAKVVYLHRDLPPLDAQPIEEHTVEAASRRVPDTIAHREDLWNQCKDDLMTQMRERLTAEVARLGGRYAHVLSESIDPRHDATTGEVWLRGRFTYMLYG